RLQLKQPLLMATLLCARAAFADGEANMRVTVFHEPSSASRGVTVPHPQADVASGLSSSLRLQARYRADICSGASPAVYGPRSGPDAITAATPFSDNRHAAHGSLEYTHDNVALSSTYEYARENDYRSHVVSVSATGELYDRNLTLGLAYTHNFDSVC